jgi:curved DNA-binding protein CbpA
VDSILLAESDILAALGLLFATDINSCREMLVSIQESDIKKAYRQKALQTHPDRFPTLGEDLRKLRSERFIEVTNAYETLNTYLKTSRRRLYGLGQRDTDPDRGAQGNGQTRRYQRQSSAKSHPFSSDFYTSSFWQKNMPGRYLRLAEFLYYSGVITWKVFVKALVWQNKQRPRIGEIAQRWNWLTEMEILRLLRLRRPGQRLGELLLHHEIISPFQLNVLLCQQRKSQRPIGEYFVQQGVLTESQIRDFLFRQKQHNLEYFSDHRR